MFGWSDYSDILTFITEEEGTFFYFCSIPSYTFIYLFVRDSESWTAYEEAAEEDLKLYLFCKRFVRAADFDAIFQTPKEG